MDRELYFANPLTFNDPFDTIPAMTLGPDEERRAFFMRGAEKMPHRHDEMVHRANNRPQDEEAQLKAAHLEFAGDLGVCCLSSRNDSVLMWSHYGMNHTGICLRFNMAVDGALRSAEEVTYGPDRPTVNPYAGKPGDLGAALRKKADFWSYEQEWRMTGPAAQSVAFPPGQLDGVIFGSRISDDNEALVRHWIAQREEPIMMLRAVCHEKTYEISFDAA